MKGERVLTAPSITIVSIVRLKALVTFGTESNMTCKYSASLAYFQPLSRKLSFHN